MRTGSILIALAATVLLPLPSARANVGCVDHPFSFVPNGRTYVAARTRMGQPCQMGFGIRGSNIETLRIIVRPSHGVLGSSAQEANRRYIAYVPSAGFIGRDRFEVHIQYMPPGIPRSLTTWIDVEMNVTP